MAVSWYGQCNILHSGWSGQQVSDCFTECDGLGEALDAVWNLRRVSVPWSGLLLPAGSSKRLVSQGAAAGVNQSASGPR